MGYIEKNIMSGEEVLYQSKLHWAVFLWPMLWFVVAVIFIGRHGYAQGLLFILIAIITGITALISYKTSEFGVTNKRVIVKVGCIRINSVEVLLSKVEAIQVNQGILGRILGFGSITVSGTGGTKDPFHKIDKPLEFRRKVQEQISAVQDSK
ncbi:MAG: PH domain-containing protein [Nitrospira sp.]